MIVGGALEEINLEKLMEDARSEFEMQQQQGITDHAALTKAVHTNLAYRGLYHVQNNPLFSRSANII